MFDVKGDSSKISTGGKKDSGADLDGSDICDNHQLLLHRWDQIKRRSPKQETNGYLKELFRGPSNSAWARAEDISRTWKGSRTLVHKETSEPCSAFHNWPSYQYMGWRPVNMNLEATYMMASEYQQSRLFMAQIIWSTGKSPTKIWFSPEFWSIKGSWPQILPFFLYLLTQTDYTKTKILLGSAKKSECGYICLWKEACDFQFH